MKKLNEVCEIVGMSRRTIQDYEESGLAKTPETKNKYGHLLYSEKDIERLWQLRFYKELGYKKRDIEKILNDPEYDKNKSLEDQIMLLEKKKLELENLIAVAKEINTVGISTFSRNTSTAIIGEAPFDVSVSMIGTTLNYLSGLSQSDKLFNEKLIDENIDRTVERIIEVLGEIVDLQEKKVLAEDIMVQEVICNLHDILAVF